MNFPNTSSLSFSGAKNPVAFLRQVREELSRVDWPSREQTIRWTVLVILSSIIVGSYIGGLDAGFTLLFKNLIK